MQTFRKGSNVEKLTNSPMKELVESILQRCPYEKPVWFMNFVWGGYFVSESALREFIANTDYDTSDYKFGKVKIEESRVRVIFKKEVTVNPEDRTSDIGERIADLREEDCVLRAGKLNQEILKRLDDIEEEIEKLQTELNEIIENHNTKTYVYVLVREFDSVVPTMYGVATYCRSYTYEYPVGNHGKTYEGTFVAREKRNINNQ
eukprot:TRINITY_DN11825_c0_g1_i1.p1 TRINITY_DN11825_c0_g1~~TRINITY_DN11825_c0_g1_i1.p1  ORF type:complete len:204 (-),score=29.35 TRINITY_DN11825_c0_g1_i1:48-659(-)